MLIPIIIIVAVIIVGLIIVVSLRPATFRITRSATLPAPPAAVFAQVNDLHLWQVWSPWAKLDPNSKNNFTGAASGTGASMSWVGNNKVGEGKMTITDSLPNQMIRFRLEFLKPFKATNTAEFNFKPEGSQTTVTWSMSGTNNFMGKLMGLVMNCDKMVGGQFEQGLANLRAVVEQKG